MSRLRTMDEDELARVLDWAADEGWNPGLDDAAAFFAADPQGFFMAEDGGSPVAAISVVNHSDDFAFLGLYLCRPSHRGRGIGYALWQHAIDHAGSRTIGLDGVPDQQDNYARSGFVRAGETTRYSGMIAGADAGGIAPAQPADIAALVALEADASGARKPAYLSAWFTQTPHRVTLLSRRDGVPSGCVTVRKCRDGAKIGPLIATDGDQARALIARAALEFDGPVILDVPASAEPLHGLCRAQGMAPGFETARMYRGAFTPSAAPWFAVTSLELG